MLDRLASVLSFLILFTFLPFSLFFFFPLSSFPLPFPKSPAHLPEWSNQVLNYSLTSWNLPYAALAKAHGVSTNGRSAFEAVPATPGYLRIHSPEAITPGRTPPPPSPTMQLVQLKAAQDRSSLMLQGRFQELLASCGSEDRV